MINHEKSEFYFLSALLAGIALVVFFVFKPFLYALVLAAVCATIFAPLYQKILRIMSERIGIAALLSVVAILLMIVLPGVILGVQLAHEASGLYETIAAGDGSALESIKNIFPASIKSTFDVGQYAKQGLEWALQHLGSLFANIAEAAINVFIFLVALYYLFKDGQKLKAIMVAVSPLQNIHDEAILEKLSTAINAVIKGSLAVAFAQGFLTAVGLALFGMSNVTLWGSVATMTALIPGVGTAAVIIPAALFLYFSGEAAAAFGLAAWGIVVVGLADNILRPMLVGQGTRMHPLLVLLAMIGGIGFFGPIGFLLGPLTITLFAALIEIYPMISKEHI